MAAPKTARNDITGAFLRTTFNKDEYRTNWEKIFGDKSEQETEEDKQAEETAEQDEQEQTSDEDE